MKLALLWLVQIACTVNGFSGVCQGPVGADSKTKKRQRETDRSKAAAPAPVPSTSTASTIPIVDFLLERKDWPSQVFKKNNPITYKINNFIGLFHAVDPQL